MEKYYKRTFAKKASYKNIEFDSTMERDFAMFLDGQIIRYKGANYYHAPIKWEYESKAFELLPQEPWVDQTQIDKTVKKIKRNKIHTLQRVIYTCDFYLPEHNLNIECKGFAFDDALFALRLRLFKHVYPKEKIAIIRSHTEFMNIDEIIAATKISELLEESK